jgi:hypothetical protein
VADDEKYLAPVAARERCDDKTLVSGPSDRRHEPLLLQTM